MPVTHVEVELIPGTGAEMSLDKDMVEQLLGSYRTNLKGLKGQDAEFVKVIIGRLEAALKLFD